MKQKDIEIPFGAKDSELCECEYTIPKGYEAEIKDGKVIVKKVESKDEKIRKDILAYLKGEFGDGKKQLTPYTHEIPKWYAWLERHGEQKPEYPLAHEKMETERWKEACKAACNDRNYRSHYGLTETRDDYFVDGVHWADEHPKQKLEWSEKCIAEVFEKVGLARVVRELANDELTNALQAAMIELSKSNQYVEWSEEDKKGLGDALWCCKQAASIAKNENDMGNAWYAENWLESLKDRVQLQPKSEWSEEDYSILQDAISCVHHIWADEENNRQFCSKVISHTTCEIETWLKSLRPQKQWKPSEEQIKALEWQLKNTSDSWQYDATKELLEQLKAL